MCQKEENEAESSGKITKQGNSKKTKAVLGCGLLLIVLFVSIVIMLATKPLEEWYLYYFRSTVQSSASELKDWSRSVCGREPGGVPDTLWSPEVTKLQPRCVSVEGDGTVILTFSKSGFYQYGIIILPDGTSSLQNTGDMTLPLKEEGVYVFFGD